MFRMEMDVKRRDKLFGRQLALLLFVGLLLVVPIPFLSLDFMFIYTGSCIGAFFISFWLLIYLTALHNVNAVIVEDGWLTVKASDGVRWRVMLDYLRSVNVEKGGKRIRMEREDGDVFVLDTGAFDPAAVGMFISFLKEESGRYCFTVSGNAPKRERAESPAGDGEGAVSAEDGSENLPYEIR